jgi:hypothetical protein
MLDPEPTDRRTVPRLYERLRPGAGGHSWEAMMSRVLWHPRAHLSDTPIADWGAPTVGFELLVLAAVLRSTGGLERPMVDPVRGVLGLREPGTTPSRTSRDAAAGAAPDAVVPRCR